MPDIIKKTVHVHFTDAQRATLADQMADVQSQIAAVKLEKSEALRRFGVRLGLLNDRMSEYASAVRAGEGDIVIDCMWKPDASQPIEHLWRLDTMEILEARALSRTAKEKADAEKAHQLDLVTPTAAPGPDGLVVAGAEPGTEPKLADVIRLRTGPTPPCPAPVEDAPGGICGADGDRDLNGFCAEHHGELSVPEMESILQSIAESRRLARLQASAERRAVATREMDEAEEDSAWAGLHAQADRAKGEELDGIGGKLGCARAVEEGEGASGDTYRAKESDGAYRVRVKVAIDQAHKGAAARAALRPAPPPEVTGDGAVPPIVREKPREMTHDLIAQLAQATRGSDIGGELLRRIPDEMSRAGWNVEEQPIDDGPAPGNEAPPDEATEDDEAPGNEAAPPPPADEVIDGPQPLYNARRSDGWPLCPHCGADELHSASVPPRERTIVNCMACGWRPPVAPGEPAQAEPAECPKVRRPVSSEERAAKTAKCTTCGKPINIRPVVEDGAWVATLAKHRTADPAP